ncbi:MAG: hypothetical protein GF320_17520 [Armatimonadia bacterium]|nr:hypothetical protein [Armatimonadia bacterium]
MGWKPLAVLSPPARRADPMRLLSCLMIMASLTVFSGCGAAAEPPPGGLLHLPPPGPELAEAFDQWSEGDAEARAEAEGEIRARGREAAPYLAAMAALDVRSVIERPQPLGLLETMDSEVTDELAWALLHNDPDCLSGYRPQPSRSAALGGPDAEDPLGVALARRLDAEGLALLDEITYMLGQSPPTNDVREIMEEHLDSGDPVVVLAAATVLAKSHSLSGEAVSRLVELCGHPWPRMRAMAARCLGGQSQPGAAAQSVLLSLLADESLRVRGAAIMALDAFQDLPREAEHGVVEAFDSPIPLVRSTAASLVTRIEGLAVPAREALSRLSADEDPGVAMVAMAAQAILDGEAETAVSMVMDVVPKGEPAGLLDGLGRGPDVKHFDVAIRMVGGDDVDAVAGYLTADDADQVCAAVRGLRLLGAEGEAALLEALRDDPEMALGTADLAGWPLSRADELRPLLRAPSESVREAAITAFGRLSPGSGYLMTPDSLSDADRFGPRPPSLYQAPEEPCRALSYRLLDEGTDASLAAAGRVLTASPLSQEEALAALASDHPDLQAAGVRAVGWREIEGASLEAVERVLAEGHPRARLQAAIRLARGGQHPAAVEHILKVMDDTDGLLGHTHLLGYLSKPGEHVGDVVAVLARVIEVGKPSDVSEVCRVMDDLGADAAPLVEPLAEFYLDTAPTDRLGADVVASALAATGPESVEALTDSLRVASRHRRVYALLALGLTLDKLMERDPANRTRVAPALADAEAAGAPLVGTLIEHLAAEPVERFPFSHHVGRALTCAGPEAAEAILERLPTATDDGRARLLAAFGEMGPVTAPLADHLDRYANEWKPGPSRPRSLTKAAAAARRAQAALNPSEPSPPMGPWQRLRLRWRDDWEGQAIDAALDADSLEGEERGWLPLRGEIEPRPVAEIDALLAADEPGERLRGLKALARLGWLSDPQYRGRVVSVVGEAERTWDFWRDVIAKAPPRERTDLIADIVARSTGDASTLLLRPLTAGMAGMWGERAPSLMALHGVLGQLRRRMEAEEREIPMGLAQDLAWLGDASAMQALIHAAAEAGSLPSPHEAKGWAVALGADTALLLPPLLSLAEDPSTDPEQRIGALKLVAELGWRPPSATRRIARLAETSDDDDVAARSLVQQGPWRPSRFAVLTLWYDPAREQHSRFSSLAIGAWVGLF